jgi:hypothetical protein
VRIGLPIAAAFAMVVGGTATVAGETRPRLDIADPGRSCPAVAGSFVALLDPDRGMVLLSAAEFLGGRRVGAAAGGALRLALPEAGSPTLARAVTAPAGGEVWGAVYPFTGEHVAGCVAFDRDRFSSEGDLVTYLRWVVDEVYLAIPDAERAARPAFSVSNRDVRLRVEGLGFQPLPLSGREGGAIPFRLPGVSRTFLLTPFVLDAASGRILAVLASTAQEFWQGGDKQRLGTIVASPDAPGTLADPPITVVVEAVTQGRQQ